MSPVGNRCSALQVGASVHRQVDVNLLLVMERGYSSHLQFCSRWTYLDVELEGTLEILAQPVILQTGVVTSCQARVT